MGLSHKSHGKRSDKETQSPMLKIFKDMIQKDKRDPEKTNLLKEKHDRKRKHYSGSRSKSGRQTVSSSSDHPKNEPYKMTPKETRHAQFDGCASQHTLPFQGEKRESWWFWGDTDPKKPEAEDSCSCVSCALKKLINTDYACMACIAILLVVSVVVAVMLIYKSIPTTTAVDQQLDTGKTTDRKSESERLKRKIDTLGKWSFGPKKQWRNIFKRNDDGDFATFNFRNNDISSLVESENELSKILDSDKLTDIQHSDRLRDFYRKLVQTDAAIRKLRKTLSDNAYTSTNFDLNTKYDFNNNFDTNNDFEINDNYNINNNMDVNTDYDSDSDRLKRSINFNPSKLFYFKRPVTESKINNGKLITKSTINMTSNKKPNDKDSKTSRNKRFGNFTDEGFVIEKNKVMIQYKPSRVVPKCSHSPIDSKSHEKELSHPFYKNTQRLDELLDQFIDKKLPDLLANHFELNTLFDKNNKKCKHPVNEELVVVKDDDLLKDYEQNQRAEENQGDSDGKDYGNQIMENSQANNERVDNSKVLDKEHHTTVKAFLIAKDAPKIVSKDIKHSVKVFENDFFEDSDGVEKKNAGTTTSGYDILLSISTLVNPAVKRTTYKPTTAFAERPNLRKLLQANMKVDDGVAYEDLKEVLTDYKKRHDDEEKESDRKKRDDPMYGTQIKMIEEKHIPIAVHNPNWKGPMPLYPDELTQMIIKDQDPDKKVDIPIHNRDSAPETEDTEPVKTDVEYVEDYLGNGYERLVELAQAYSDYGVLNEKKNVAAGKKASDKEHKLENRKAGISMKRLRGSLKRGLKKKHLFERMQKSKDLSEGIRIEIQPDSKTGENKNPDDVNAKFKEIFNKHVKIIDEQPSSVPTQYSPVPELTTHIEVSDLSLPISGKIKQDKGYEFGNNVVFKKRTLKTADMINITNPTDAMNKNSDKVKDNNDKIDIEILSEIKSKYDGTNKMITGNITKLFKTTLNSTSVDLVNTGRTKSETKHKEKTTKSNEKENESSLSNFFMLLSKWFSTLDGMEIAGKNKSNMIPSTKENEIHRNKTKTQSQLAYPVYDSDMIENIGHRSRVLLSVEAINSTEKTETHLIAEDDRNQIVKASSTESMNNVNSTRSLHETTKSPKNDDAVSNETNNRVVKRQAIDDSNLIFWNDLYDEEYGINADPIDNNIRDKHSADKNDFITKSNSWLQDKMKKITERFYPSNPKKPAVEKPEKDDKAIPINKSTKQINTKKGNTKQCNTKQGNTKQVKRNIKYDSDDDDGTVKLDLAALTERMKEVCKETVKAVQETKHIEVREGNGGNQAAASLMQQLVRLMTDLVDFQVQERTCRRLPADLQSFLDWLTSSKEEDQDPDNFYRGKTETNRFGIDFANKLDKPTEQDLLQPSERENTDSKTDCLGTLHAVQNLIREYEEMTEDDKSVMTGVKNYLENQMHFLQRQLSSIDEKSFGQGSRFRRDAIMNIGHTVADTIDQTAQSVEKQYKNLKQMYYKYKGKIGPAYKEALKTTAQINKAVTEMAHKISNPKGKNHHNKVLKHNKILKTNDKTKDQLKKGKVQKDKKHKHRSLSKFCQKNKVNSKDNANFKDDVNFAMKKDDLFGMNTDQAFSDKDERNIKDVYFKAVEEAKKSSSKGAHMRDTDIFDKTDIFRINDYVGGKEK